MESLLQAGRQAAAERTINSHTANKLAKHMWPRWQGYILLLICCAAENFNLLLW